MTTLACCSTDPAEAERIGLRVPHPPYSPDLSATDYHLFKHLDNFLHEKCFKSRDDAESAFNDSIASRTTDLYANGINKLVSYWQKCVDSKGSYFD